MTQWSKFRPCEPHIMSLNSLCAFVGINWIKILDISFFNPNCFAYLTKIPLTTMLYITIKKLSADFKFILRCVELPLMQIFKQLHMVFFFQINGIVCKERVTYFCVSLNTSLEQSLITWHLYLNIADWDLAITKRNHYIFWNLYS